MAGFHEKMKSHFVVPKRMEALAAANPDARVETYNESANLPMDIVIRMDLSEKIPPHAIKINLSAARSAEPTPVTRQDIADEEDDD